MKTKRFLIGLLCAGALLLGACSGGGGDSKSSGSDHVHNYQFNSFEWTTTPGAYTAKAVYVCSENSEHVITYDAAVSKLTSSIPSTCSTGGVNKWQASYDGHEEVKDELLEKAPHTHDEMLGFCSVCGEYLGNTAAGLTYSVTKNLGEKEYFRVPVLPERDYSWEMDMSFFGMGSAACYRKTNGEIDYFYGDNPAEVPADSDGYVYFVVDFAKSGLFTATFELLTCDHSSVNGLGFCTECHKYMGSTFLYEPDIKINMATLSGANQHNFRIGYYKGGLLHLFYPETEDSEHNAPTFSLYYIDELGSFTPISMGYAGEVVISKDLDVSEEQPMQYIYVHVDYTNLLTGYVYYNQLTNDCYDLIPGHYEYHGPTMTFDSLEAIDDLFVSSFPSGDDTAYRYIVMATGLITNQCYKFFGVDFAINHITAYYSDSSQTNYVQLTNDYRFVAPSDEILFNIYSLEPLTHAKHVRIDSGHFHIETDPYKGFYCSVHENPVWLGEVSDLVFDYPYTNVNLAVGESKYYRFELGDTYEGHGFEVDWGSSNPALYQTELYHFDGYQMVEEEEVGQGVWPELSSSSQCKSVGNEEEVYYFLRIKNISNSSQTFSFTPKEVHHYSGAGVCDNCGSFDPDGITAASLTETFSFYEGDQNYVRFAITRGHKHRVEIDEPAIWNDDEIHFYYVDDEANTYTLSTDDIRDGVAFIPEDSDGYLYIYIETEADRNSVGFVVSSYHVMDDERCMCACGEFGGADLTVGGAGIPVSGFDNNTRRYFRIPFAAGYTYHVNVTEQIGWEEMKIYYVDINTYDWKEVSWTPGTGDELDFVIPSSAGCSDEPGYEYIWITLHNLSGGVYNLTNFKVTRTAL